MDKEIFSFEGYDIAVPMRDKANLKNVTEAAVAIILAGNADILSRIFPTLGSELMEQLLFVTEVIILYLMFSALEYFVKKIGKKDDKGITIDSASRKK